LPEGGYSSLTGSIKYRGSFTFDHAAALSGQIKDNDLVFAGVQPRCNADRALLLKFRHPDCQHHRKSGRPLSLRRLNAVCCGENKASRSPRLARHDGFGTAFLGNRLRRDHWVMKHLKSLNVANTELSACDKNTQPKTCDAFEKEIEKDRSYINAAIDGKY
jgi:hypothetical protein